MSQSSHRSALAPRHRVPSGVRRSVPHAAIGRPEPKPSQVSLDLLGDRTVPRIVVGPLSSASGLGQSARLAAMALKNDGYRVAGLDISPLFREVGGIVAHGIPDAGAHSGPAHVVLVVRAPYAPYALASLGGAFLKDKLVTGYWAWDLPRLPRRCARGSTAAHAVAAPSLFTAEAVCASSGGQPVRVCPPPVALDHPPLSPFVTGGPRPEQPFTVVSTLSLCSGFARRNPLALIRAFKLAFGARKDRRLRLLITGAEQSPTGRAAILSAVGRASNIEVAWKPLNRSELWAWWGAPDVYARLHRSTGFGLTLAEAMCSGLPVVATGWSGNMDYMTDWSSLPVRFRLCDIIDPQRQHAATEGHWAEPDVEHAAELLQMLAACPDRAREIGRTAHRAMRVRLTGQSFCRGLLA